MLKNFLNDSIFELEIGYVCIHLYQHLQIVFINSNVSDILLLFE